MSSPNASPPPESTAEMAARLSTDLFNPIPSTYPQSSSQMAPPYYQQNPQQEPLPYFQQYPQQEPLPYFQQYPQYPHQTYGGTSSGIGSSSQFTTPIASTPSPNVPEIQAEEEVAAQSAQQVAPIAAPAAKKKKTTRAPGYGAEWLPWYEVTYHADGTMNTLHCKVKGCPKGHFTYVKANGMSSFKRHADSHKGKNERPQENADPRLIQTLMNPDGTHTHHYRPKKRATSYICNCNQ